MTSPPNLPAAKAALDHQAVVSADQFCEQAVLALEQQLGAMMESAPEQYRMQMVLGILARFISRALLGLGAGCAEGPARDMLQELTRRLATMVTQRAAVDVQAEYRHLNAESFSAWAGPAISGLFTEAATRLHGRVLLTASLLDLGTRR